MVSRKLGHGARRIRKFGDVAAVVAKQAGLGDVSRKVKTHTILIKYCFVTITRM